MTVNIVQKREAGTRIMSTTYIKKGALSIEPLALDGDHCHLKNTLVRFNPVNQHHLYKKLQMMKQ